MPSESSADEEEEEEELQMGGVNDHEVLPFHETTRGGAKLETRFKHCKRMRAALAVATMVEATEQREEEGRDATIIVFVAGAFSWYCNGGKSKLPIHSHTHMMF